MKVKDDAADGIQVVYFAPEATFLRSRPYRGADGCIVCQRTSRCGLSAWLTSGTRSRRRSNVSRSLCAMRALVQSRPPPTPVVQQGCRIRQILSSRADDGEFVARAPPDEWGCGSHPTGDAGLSGPESDDGVTSDGPSVCVEFRTHRWALSQPPINDRFDAVWVTQAPVTQPMERSLPARLGLQP